MAPIRLTLSLIKLSNYSANSNCFGVRAVRSLNDGRPSSSIIGPFVDNLLHRSALENASNWTISVCMKTSSAHVATLDHLSLSRRSSFRSLFPSASKFPVFSPRFLWLVLVLNRELIPLENSANVGLLEIPAMPLLPRSPMTMWFGVKGGPIDFALAERPWNRCFHDFAFLSDVEISRLGLHSYRRRFSFL